jgi:hypothetical protein
VCANENQLMASVCVKTDKYRVDVLQVLKKNEEKCSAEKAAFVARNPVNGQGACDKPPVAPIPGTMQTIMEHATVAGVPLSKAPVAITQLSMSLHPIGVNSAATPTNAPTAAPTQDFAAEGVGNASLVLLDQMSRGSSTPVVSNALAACHTSRTVVCGIAANQPNSTSQNTFCVDRGNTQCDEVCVQSTENCDLEAGGQVVIRPYLDWLSKPQPEVCCYPECKVPAHVTNTSVTEFCRVDAPLSETVEGNSTEDDTVVVMLDDSPLLDDSLELGSSNIVEERQADNVESVGPFKFTVWQGSAPVLQSEATAACYVKRTEQCHVKSRTGGRKLLQADDFASIEAGTAVECTTKAHAACKEVSAPKSLCEGTYGGELVQKGDETVCAFKDCKTPFNWANQAGGQIHPDAWCYMKNIQYGANFV